MAVNNNYSVLLKHLPLLLELILEAVGGNGLLEALAPNTPFALGEEAAVPNLNDKPPGAEPNKHTKHRSLHVILSKIGQACFLLIFIFQQSG